MTSYDKAEQTAKYLLNRLGTAPDTVAVLGSGLGAFANEIEREAEIDYSDIPNFPVSTAPGHAGKLICGNVGGRRILAMQGRFHLYEGYSVDEITLPVRAFSIMGVKNYIATNAAGAVNLDYKPGELMIITDHIGLFCPSALWGENDERFGVRFPSMNEVYSRRLAEIAKKASLGCSLNVHSGVYCYCKGAMFETPAEIRFLRTAGVDAVGMSTVPETVAAVHSGMNVLGISCLTNMAAGILDTPLTHEEVTETGKKIEKDFSVYMKKIISML